MPTGIYKHPPQCGFQKGHKSTLGKHWKLSEETKKKISEGHKGLKWKEGRKGYLHSEETKKKMSKIKMGKPILKTRGEKHWNWRGGITENPYPKEFNSMLRLKIRTRDNFICCLCGKTEREELEELNRVLAVNHINFDKNDCRKENLNTLCARCNVKINRERDYWTDYFNTNQRNL